MWGHVNTDRTPVLLGLHFGFWKYGAASMLTGAHSLLRMRGEFSGGCGAMSRLTGAPGHLRTCLRLPEDVRHSPQ